MESPVEAFLSQEEEQAIVAAIRDAETKTSGEIRVHIEASAAKEPLDRVKELFHLLKMDNTKEENGVLIYVAVKEHRFAIYGDVGINKVVPADFWESTRDQMQRFFREGAFKKGLVAGVTEAGKQLAHYFPWDHTDHNELSDQISKG